MAGAALAAKCRRSARFWHAWLERGGSSPAEADAVFTDAALCARLAAPLQRFEAPAASATQALGLSAGSGGEAPLPARAAELAKVAAEALGVSQEVADDLVRLLADDQLGGFSTLHYGGDALDLLEVGEAAALPELGRLLHTEKCEALQVVACVLRTAQDDSHSWSAQCRELVHRLLKEGLVRNLWQIYTDVSSGPKFASVAPERAEVLGRVRAGLDLQLCVLECLLLAFYDPELRPEMTPPAHTQLAAMAELILRQRCLGSLRHAAHAHGWLLSDSEACARAQRVGDLCLAVLLQGLALEDIAVAHGGRHPLLCSPDDAKRLHRIFTSSWIEMCEHVDASRSSARPDLVHCARLASLGVLGWASVLAAMPQGYREEHRLGFERIVGSSLLRSSRLVRDAAHDIVERGFLLKDAPNRHHGAARSAIHGLLTAAAAGFRLEGPLSGVHAAMSALMAAVFEGEPEATAHFWSTDYCSQRGCFFVLHGWLAAFPAGLTELLHLLAGLASSVHALAFVQAPLDTLIFPLGLLQQVAETVAAGSPTAAGAAPSALGVVLRQSVYAEELALRVHGLVLPEWHLPLSTVLHAEAHGSVLGGGSDGQAGASGGRRARFKLEGQGVSTWRVALAAWDAILAGMGWTTCQGATGTPLPPSATQLLLAVLRCVCRLLDAGPQAFVALSEHLPADELEAMDGIIVRLYVSFFVCADLPQSQGQSILPMLLRALESCLATHDPASRCATLVHLLEGTPHPRFRAHGCVMLVRALSARLDHEREAGCYPTTLAALGLLASLLEACPTDLLALSPSGAGEEAIGQLLDFTFGVCFARCSFWACRTPSDRWQLSLACARVATALMPLMECFNWPLPPGLGPQGPGGQDMAIASEGAARLSEALAGLRALQLRVLRSWSEAAFVPSLLQCLSCDVVFGAAPGKSGRQFIGFRSPAQDDGSCTHDGVPELGDVGPPPAGGAQLLVGALRCLHGLLSLVLHPAGFAPQYASLAQHLLEVSVAREPLEASRGPWAFRSGLAAQDGIGVVPRRADLAQSLYAHTCAEEPAVARWAASSLAALCALWHRADSGLLPQSGGACWAVAGGALPTAIAAPSGAAALPRKALLLAFLSMPSAGPVNSTVELGADPLASSGAPTGQATRPASLTPHLARRLLGSIGDAREDIALRCAFADLSRAALAAQPGLFLDEATELLPKAVLACCNGIADALAAWSGDEAEMDADPGRLLVALVPLLDDLAAADASVLRRSFAQPVHARNSKRIPSVWSLLSALPGALRKWTSELKACRGDGGLRSPEPLVVLSAAFRIAQRGCHASADIQHESPEAHVAFLGLLGTLLGPVGIDLWLPPPLKAEDGAEISTKDPSTFEGGSLMRNLFGSKCGNTPDEGKTYGVEDFLARHQLRTELLGPAGATLATDAQASSGLGWLAQLGGGSELWQVACGADADPSASAVAGPALLRDALPQEHLGCFGVSHGVTAVHTGSRTLDSLVVGAPLLPAHLPSARLALGWLCEHDAQKEALAADCADVSQQKVLASARALAVEAFDNLVCTAIRQSMNGKDSACASAVRPLLGSLLECLVRHLYFLVQHMELLADHTALFARMVTLTTRMLWTPPQAAALLRASPQALVTLGQDFGDGVRNPPIQEVPFVRDMLEHETPLGLALVSRLSGALRLCTKQASLAIGKAAAAGHLEVALATLPLLLLLVPALQQSPRRKPAAGTLILAQQPGASCSPEAEEVLLELLEAVAMLPSALGPLGRPAADATMVAREPPQDSAAAFSASWLAGAPVAWPVEQPGGLLKRRGLTVLRSPDEAVARAALRAQSEVMDRAVASGFSATALAVAERAVAALGQGGKGPRVLGERSLALMQRSLLPHLLGRTSPVLAPCPESLLPGGQFLWSTMPSIPAAGAMRPACWARASEAASACQLGSVLSVLLAAAQTASGAVLLAEHRVFAVLACSPLLREATLPSDTSGRFPAAYAWPTTAGALQRGLDDPMGSAVPQATARAPWRRPLHACWCRALLLVATLLASAPQLGPEVVVFLEAFAPRLRYLFRGGLRTGHMAMLEEAAVACRVLALVRHRCSIVESILADAATQAFVFVVGTCLAERLVPSEVFLPVSEAERIAAKVEPDGEGSPAEVPSVFHQRVERLALDLERNLLAAMLHMASSPTWLGHAGVAGSSVLGGAASATAQGAWPSSGPSSSAVLGGLRPPGSAFGAAVGASDGAAGQRLWAAIMDVTLEGARRAVEVLEAMQGQRPAGLLLVGAAGAVDDALVPLSLALAPLEPESALPGAESALLAGPAPSPGGLAKGLRRPSSLLQSPTAGPSGSPLALSVLTGKEQAGMEEARSERYRRMAPRPGLCLGGQLADGVLPEWSSLPEMRQLCCSILEMACTLLCHFCQATQSGALAGGERSAAPGASVLHGLLSFLHELCTSSSLGSLGVDPAASDYIEALHDGLRFGQRLGAVEADSLPLAASATLAVLD